MLIVRPDGTPTEECAKLAPAPDATGLVVGILDNRKDNAGRLFSVMQQEFISQAAGRAGPAFQKSYVNIPAQPEVIVGLADACDLVLVGSGD